MSYVLTSLSGNLISAASAGFAPTNGADVSAIASSYAESAMSSKLDESATADFYLTSNPSGFITGVDLSDYATTAYVDSSVSGKLDTTAYNSSDFYSTSNPSGFITGVDLSDYATTAYVDSSVSSKLDTTAFNSGDFYGTSNPSGFIDSAYVDSAVSSKADSSALSSYALSADVSGTVDLVSTQSANWGGSALALSAGPGVKLEKVGDTLVASTDETVLWSDSVGSATVTASENIFNFERCRVTYMGGALIPGEVEREILSSTTAYNLTYPYFRADSTNFIQFQCTTMTVSNNGTTVDFTDGKRLWIAPSAGSNGNDTQPIKCTKIVGINRTAGV